MKRLLAIAIPITAVIVWLSLREDEQNTPERAPAKAAPAEPAAPIATSCTISGVLIGGMASQVVVRSIQEEIDLLAALEGDRFSAELPDPGPITIIAVERDGRTVERSADCIGRLHVTLEFPKARGSAAVRGRCVYLDTGAPVAGAIVRAKREWSAIAGEDGGSSSASLPAVTRSPAPKTWTRAKRSA